MDLKLYGDCIISLIKAAFSGEAPKELPEQIDIDVLIDIAVKHSIASIVCEPLMKLEGLEQAQAKKLKAIYNFSVMNDATQSYYFESVTEKFEENAIPHCVLKGPVIKELYPKSYFRQSGDLDIFVPNEYSEKARDIMLELGFEIERFNFADADDVYFIGKKIHIELHRILVSNKTSWQKKCQEITERLVLADGKQYEYEMTPEDYYLYMIAHMAKHMYYSGMGIKMVLDVFVYLEKYDGLFDKSVLSDRLEACGLAEFEKNVRRLVDFWFKGKHQDETIQKLGYYVFSSGAFGTKEQLDASSYANDAGNTNSPLIAKFVYYWKFFFQSYKWMCNRYPILNKIPVLLPFCWVHRALKTLLFEREKAKLIASQYDSSDLEESKQLQKFKREIGL